MIQKAEEKKKACGDQRILFWTNDFEYEQLTEEWHFSGNTDLIVASFGMGSFIEDTAGMLRRFSQWLRPGGKILLSFYNENSSVLRLTPTWRDTSLASNINPATKSLRVDLPGGASFEILCKPFNEGTKGEINKIFDIERLYTFPTALALLPNSLLKDNVAAQLFGQVDEILSGLVMPIIPPRGRGKAKIKELAAELEGPLARYGEVGYGHYVIVVAKKPEPTSIGYLNAVATLEREAHDEYEIITHGPVLSLRDVRRELGTDIPLGAMIKTLIFKERNGKLIAVSVPGDVLVDKDRFAEMLKIGRRSLRFASEKEVSQLGFPLGGIAPVGFEVAHPVRRFVDASLEQTTSQWLYSGIGDNRKTLKIKKQVFLTLVSECEFISIPRLAKSIGQ
jgi:prolyl-tRNA editing enzyme YbaK/EbsC (Cys-tRNA(Pro) deacylase)